MGDSGPSVGRGPWRRNGERGVGLLEVLMAVVIGALGLMAHASGVLRGHNLSRTEESRTLALQTLRELLERLRCDDNWPGLYGRLAALLDTNGGWHSPSEVYADLEASSRLGTCTIRIELPRSPSATSPGTLVLREDVTDAVFGLPHDLNGDGTIGSAAVTATHVVLPVRVRFRWQSPGEPQQEIVVPTWLTGERL
jgi:hypothetical protein